MNNLWPKSLVLTTHESQLYCPSAVAEHCSLVCSIIVPMKTGAPFMVLDGTRMSLWYRYPSVHYNMHMHAHCSCIRVRMCVLIIATCWWEYTRTSCAQCSCIPLVHCLMCADKVQSACCCLTSTLQCVLAIWCECSPHTHSCTLMHWFKSHNFAVDSVSLSQAFHVAIVKIAHSCVLYLVWVLVAEEKLLGMYMY